MANAAGDPMLLCIPGLAAFRDFVERADGIDGQDNFVARLSVPARLVRGCHALEVL